MKKFSQIAGLCGIVLLFFGIVSFLFTREFSLYTVFQLSGGCVLVVFSLVVNLGGLWSALGERSTRYSANAVLYTAIFLGLLVLVNIMSNAHSWRKDLTEGELFSISSQSEKVLNNLKDNVEVLAFFQQGKGTKLEDLLKNFSHYSPKFIYEFIDPVKHPEKAKAYDVTTSDILVVKCGPRDTKITGTTEEDLTNAILKVAKTGQKKVYFLTGHGEKDLSDESEQGYQIVQKALENENYVVEPLKLYMHKDVPADCAVLVVAGPEKVLEQAELDAIDTYLADGGDALFLLDPRSTPGLDRFLSKWGFKVGDNIVVDQVFRLFYGPSLGVDPIVEEYGTHAITEDFEGQTLFHMVRSVDVAEELPTGVNAVSLAKTSPKSWAETDLDLFFSKSEVSLSSDDVNGPVSVAVALTAEAGEKETDSEPSREDVTEKKQAKVVVVGDADFVDNQYIAKMYNGDLFLNIINWLAGEDAYISIRPKSTRGSMVVMTPEQTHSIFYTSVLIFPEVLLLIGIAIWWRRR